MSNQNNQKSTAQPKPLIEKLYIAETDESVLSEFTAEQIIQVANIPHLRHLLKKY